MRWLTNLIHRHQRALDIQILWPSCRDISPDLEQARAAFGLHAYHDKAWLVLGEDEIKRIIYNLE